VATKSARTPKPFIPGAPIAQGDFVAGDAGGGWVCLQSHVMAYGVQTPSGLKPGQSDDLWHWCER